MKCTHGLALTTSSSNRPRAEITFGSFDFVLVIPSLGCQRRQEEVLFLSLKSSASPSLLPLVNLTSEVAFVTFYGTRTRLDTDHCTDGRQNTQIVYAALAKKKSRRQGPVKMKLSLTSSNSPPFFVPRQNDYPKHLVKIRDSHSETKTWILNRWLEPPNACV